MGGELDEKPLKLRVPCDQHSARAQTQSNLSVSGLVTRRPTTDTGYMEKTQLATLNRHLHYPGKGCVRFHLLQNR